MAKGSVRKKGKKWYARFYIEDESGRKVQKEFAGTESKAETEAMLRKAIADYEENVNESGTKTLSYDLFQKLLAQLSKRSKDAVLPVQIAYFTGLRLGEVAGLTWQDRNLDEQYLTVRRSVRYNSARHKNEMGPTKRKKVRTVDFCDTPAEILRPAKKEQHKNRFQYGELYHRNYYKEVREKNRVFYEYYHLDGTQDIPDDYKEISFVCLRSGGSLELPSTVGIACRSARKKMPELEGFHFHTLRHTYTTNLLAGGAQPKIP